MPHATDSDSVTEQTKNAAPRNATARALRPLLLKKLGDGLMALFGYPTAQIPS